VETSGRNVDDFLASLPADVQSEMKSLDAIIAPRMAELPRVLFVGKFWGGSDQEIIGYGTVVSARSDGTEVEWFMVGLAAQKNYLSVYVSAVEDGKYLAEVAGRQLGKVKVGKSSISFKSVDDIDPDRLAELVARARRLLEPG